MLHSISILLALLSWFAPSSPATPCISIRQPYIAGDSTIFQQLKAQLATRQALEQPEKLYLQIDRTLFRPGETLWFNAYLRNAGDLMPALSQILYVELLDPRGSVLQKLNLLAPDGVAAGDFALNANLPGGLYKIRAYTSWMKNTESSFEREITLQKVVLPNLNLKLEFERKAYGPGDLVDARFDVLGLDNKPLENKTLRFSTAINGKTILQNSTQTDANGRAQVRFDLPKDLTSNDGLLNITLEHKGQTESISMAIPIVLNKIDLTFFPEGGDWFPGIPTRMAFKALNEFGKPADVEGTIFNDKAEKVGSFSSYHDGMGAFEMLPQAGATYYAELTKPFQAGTAVQRFKLPALQNQGLALRLQARAANELVFNINGTRPGVVHLVGAVQDKIFFFKTIKLTRAGETARIDTKNLPVGIARFTLLDEQKNAQAERLVFVNRDRGLNVDIKPNKTQYLPREEVQLDIAVHDRIGRPVKGNFSLAVVDEKLLSYADNKQGHLLASLLLEQDVKGKIEEPNFYFDEKESKSEQALDFLLMTQGWRRFEWKSVPQAPAPVYAHAQERMEVAGTVVHRNGKPWAGQVVQLYPNGPRVTTDVQGKFSFNKPDFTKFTYLSYGNDQYFPLRTYHNKIQLVSWKKTATASKFVSYRSGDGSTIVKGKITDDQGEPLFAVTVAAMRGQKIVKGAVSDAEGNFKMELSPGNYDFKTSFTGYKSDIQENINIKKGFVNKLTVCMPEPEYPLDEVVMVQEMRAEDRTPGRRVISADQIRNLPTKSVNAIVATTAPTEDEKEVLALDDQIVQEVLVEDKVKIAKDELGRAGVAGKPMADAKRRQAAVEMYMDGERVTQQTYYRARSFYTPDYKNDQNPAQRSDFRSTIYWNPAVQTDQYGKAQVRFYTSDAVSNFRATFEGIGNAGQPAHQEIKFFAQKPVELAVKVPESVIAGDTLLLKVVLNNNTTQTLSGNVDAVLPKNFEVIPAGGQPHDQGLQVAAKSTSSVILKYVIRPDTAHAGEMQAMNLTFKASNGQEDAITQSIRTYDRGFPVKMVLSGSKPQNNWQLHFNQPVEGTMQAKLTVYGSALNDVIKGMERMLRQPSGCFEQVSSSNYPNLLVLDLLRSTGRAQPETESRAMGLLKDGYHKLVAYECKSGGFDWWGRDPAHEGLTAYGILEFTDMSKVFQVDQQLIKRSVEWLKSRRDGKGGWIRREDWHGWQSNGVIGAYIAWALCEAGYGAAFNLEIEASYNQALNTDDAYQLALMANALYCLKDPRAQHLVDVLLKKQDADGSWMGNTHSVMSSSGQCFRIETTALAALALMKNGKTQGPLQKAMGFITASKNEYGYGSTQSTVLALKALVEFAKANQNNSESGIMVVQVDGKRVIEQPVSAQSTKNIELKGLERYFSSTDPEIEVFFEKMTKAPTFDLEIQYASRQPRNAKNCPLQFATELEQTQAQVGQTVRLRATLQNKTADELASPMMVIGIPAGLSLQPWQLKKLMDEKECDFYELWDGFAVFHFERLAASATKNLALDLRVEVAGTFEAPASQAFLYYDNDQRVWSKPGMLKISY